MLILVRHGQSVYNAQDIICGSLESPLTDQGREEARRSAQALIGTEIQFIYTSPLERAQETLAIFLEVIGQSPQVIVEPALIERNLGDIAGQPTSNFPTEQWQEWLHWHGKPPGGESYQEVHDRVIPWFEETVLPQAQESTVLIVGHNGVMKIMRQHLEQIPPEETSRLETPNSGARWYRFNADGKAEIVAAPEERAASGE